MAIGGGARAAPSLQMTAEAIPHAEWPSPTRASAASAGSAGSRPSAAGGQTGRQQLVVRGLDGLAGLLLLVACAFFLRSLRWLRRGTSRGEYSRVRS